MLFRSSRFSDPRTARPQGVISGFTKVDVNERKVQREKEQCTEKSNGNCTKKEKVKVDCTERRIDLTTTLRVADTKDGAILYTQSRPQTDTTSWCPDERPWRTTEKAIDDMIGKAAKKFAKDITPTRESYSVRLREEREGMDKDLGKRFKDSVKLSQRDWQAACGIWRGMDGELPNQPSLLFNLGLCAEVSGDYKSADALYRRAAGTGIRDGAFADAIDRVAKLTVGREDARVRGGR